MKIMVIISFLLLSSVDALSQSESELLYVARLGLIEKMYENNADLFRRQLANTGLTEDEIESLLVGAIDELAGCLVRAARDQALEQALPLDKVLAAVGGKVQGKEDATIALQLDSDALNQKSAPCSKEFGESVGINIQ